MTDRHGTRMRRSGARPYAGALAMASVLLSHTSALAGLTQNDVVGTGGLLSAYAGLTSGGNPDPGFDPEVGFNQVSLDEESFTGAGYASGSTDFSQSTHVGSGSGTAGLGFVEFTAASESTFDFTSFFAVGLVHGGWSDTLTITAPGLTGVPAVWTFRVKVDGLFTAGGFAGSPGIEVEPYLDHERLPFNVPGVDLGNSDPIATDVQHAEWGLVLSAIGASESESVDDMVTFAAPIVIGEPFELGVYALASAGSASNSSFPGLVTTAEVDTGTVTWGGSAGLTVNGEPVAGFAVSAESGSDWGQAVAADDFDSDGVGNLADNCLLRANPGQQDSDGDSIGNACDPDIAPQPNDCIVNVSDLAAVKSAFFSMPASPNWNEDADLDSNGVVNVSDLGTMKARFFQPPGPSGVGGACP